VLTFGPDGIYGHPDHIKAHQSATLATIRFAENNGGVGPALYYNAVSRERIQEMAKRESGPFVNMTPEQIAQLGTPDELITTVLDVAPQFERKLAAILAHRTQIGPDGPWSDLPADQVREFLSTERFRLTTQSWSRDGEDPLRDIVRAAHDLPGRAPR
jgi:LmbE family N-acetylglucosaminyl deacetylase